VDVSRKKQENLRREEKEKQERGQEGEKK